jgi:epoxyqueuosine reductase QueG
LPAFCAAPDGKPSRKSYQCFQPGDSINYGKGDIDMQEKNWLVSTIQNFMETSPVNLMGNVFGEEKIWGTPLVRFAAGADEIFLKYNVPDVCGEEHWLPAEAFAKFYPDDPAAAEELTVISWMLPQTEATKQSLRRETVNPSERWARARIIGEKANDALRAHVTDVLRAAGYQAGAPVLHPEWRMLDNVQRVYSSKWSERHIAYAAGHGTFGLCDALITQAGKAHRLGSVVAKIKIAPDERPYKDVYEYCLYYRKGACGLCVKKCPAGAISLKEGHDKKKCHAFLHGKTPAYIKEHFGLDGYGCGFCQVGVPCESAIPG